MATELSASTPPPTPDPRAAADRVVPQTTVILPETPGEARTTPIPPPAGEASPPLPLPQADPEAVAEDAAAYGAYRQQMRDQPAYPPDYSVTAIKDCQCLCTLAWGWQSAEQNACRICGGAGVTTIIETQHRWAQIQADLLAAQVDHAQPPLAYHLHQALELSPQHTAYCYADGYLVYVAPDTPPLVGAGRGPWYALSVRHRYITTQYMIIVRHKMLSDLEGYLIQTYMTPDPHYASIPPQAWHPVQQTGRAA